MNEETGKGWSKRNTEHPKNNIIEVSEASL